MSFINVLFALIILVLMTNMGYTSLKPIKEPCDCQPRISRVSKDFIICFPGCMVKAVNSKLYNISCMYMDEITISVCKGNRYISTKPRIEIHENYIWTTYILKVWKILVTISVWVLFIIFKTPSLCLISLFNKFVNKILESRLKQCESCGSNYSFSHIECPTPSFRHRADYHLSFYVILFFIVLTTFVKADDNVYNYYQHENVTEVQILDKEHYQQNFDVNGYLYTITILNSHLELDVVNISEIQMPINHRFQEMTYSCAGEIGCESEFYTKYGTKPMWSIRKSHDGLTCPFNSVVICGNCKNDYIKLGNKVITSKVKPYIDIEIRHGNKTDLIEIREFSIYKHDPYYVKPIKPILVESVEMFITGPKVYKGQLCAMPSHDCFGPNYQKDEKLYQLMTPKVKDPMTFDREVILEHCVNPGNSDVNSLTLTDQIYQNNTIIKPFEFGLISIGIPATGKLIGDFCEKPARVKDIKVNGCYDCQLGIEIKVYYDHIDRCAKIKCKVGRIEYEYFVDASNSLIILHSFYDKEKVNIECNDYLKEFLLDHSRDTSYYKTSSEVHGNVASDFNIYKHFPNIFSNIKTIVITIALLLIAIYLSICMFKQTIRHYHIVKMDKKLRYHKKTDNINGTEVVEMDNNVVIEGDAQ